MRAARAVGSALALLLALTAASAPAQDAEDSDVIRMRFATFNASLFGSAPQQLAERLRGRKDEQLRRVAATLQAVRPDVVLINEFDYDPSGRAVEDFIFNYLLRSQQDDAGIRYRFHHVAAVNSGLASNYDLNRDGKIGGGNDAWGFGDFPGQYGMLVLSRYPIDEQALRSFRKFRWRDMPGALLPTHPSGHPWYSDTMLRWLPLSSKSHWDVPIRTRAGAIHFLVAHPTPPVYDGEEDRNGRRNHDEIRLLADYASGDPGRSAYIYDDDGGRGGLASDQAFVIAGDMNADPEDGDSWPGAIAQLLEHPHIHAQPVPASAGAVESAHRMGGSNLGHQGDPRHDTAVFGDPPGNLRVDYVLPSTHLRVIDSGVYWPLSTEDGADALNASDHRLVWVDVEADVPPAPQTSRRRVGKLR